MKVCPECNSDFEKTYAESVASFERRTCCSKRCAAVRQRRIDGESVALWLRSRGLNPEFKSGAWAVDEKRLRIKTSPLKNGRWFFNLHRHNSLDESSVDWYVLRLRFPRKHPVHLVMPAPLEVKTLAITLDTLRTKYAQYIDNAAAICSYHAQVSSGSCSSGASVY